MSSCMVAFSNFGLPVNCIAADILRTEDGILVEHWDVIQDEVTLKQSKSHGMGTVKCGGFYASHFQITLPRTPGFNGRTTDLMGCPVATSTWSMTWAAHKP